MDVDGEIARLHRQIEKVENDTEKAVNDIEKVENTIQGGDLTPEDKQYWWEEKRALWLREQSLREEKLLDFKLKNEDDPRVKRQKSGAAGENELLEMEFKISSGVREVEDRYQFYIPREKRFYYAGDKRMEGQDGRCYYFPPCGLHNPDYAVLFKCQKNSVATDARIFLLNTKDVVYEFWIQLKGQDHPLGKEEAEKCYKAAFDPKFKVDGRIKIYVLCNTNGFCIPDVQAITPENVLLLNLAHFMPEFIRQSRFC